MQQITLRPYQKTLINNVETALQTYQRVCLQLPTGAGKTVIASEWIRLQSLKKKKVLFLVHRKELLDQASSQLKAVEVPHGKICAGVIEPSEHLTQVAMIQSFVSKLNFTPDIIVYDEAHHARSTTFRKIFETYPKAKLLGLTATPERMDGLGLHIVFEHLIIGPQIADLIDQGYLANFDLYSVPVQFDANKLRTQNGEYKTSDVVEQLNRPAIYGDVIRTYQKYLERQSAILFAPSVAMSKEFARTFNDANISAVHVDGDMSPKRRDDAIEKFATGKALILTNSSLVSEGFDMPHCKGVIMTRPTRSTALYLQMVGRALRPNQDQKKSIILDHVQNYKKHGMPDYPHLWTILGRNEDFQAAEAIKVCKECGYIFNYMSTKNICPKCAADNQEYFKRQAYEQFIDIELVNINREQAENTEQQLQKCTTLQDIAALAQEQNYSDDWVAMQWIAKQHSPN